MLGEAAFTLHYNLFFGAHMNMAFVLYYPEPRIYPANLAKMFLVFDTCPALTSRRSILLGKSHFAI